VYIIIFINFGSSYSKSISIPAHIGYYPKRQEDHVESEYEAGIKHMSIHIFTRQELIEWVYWINITASKHEINKNNKYFASLVLYKLLH
jgi:hypothetical protein